MQRENHYLAGLRGEPEFLRLVDAVLDDVATVVSAVLLVRLDDEITRSNLTRLMVDSPCRFAGRILMC